MRHMPSATRRSAAARYFQCAILAVAAALSASPASAVTEIRTAAQEASEPKFVTILNDGKPEVGGICVDIMRAIEHVDPRLKFVGDNTWQPLARMEAGLLAGNLDAVCGLLRSKPRDTQYTYVPTPLFSVNYHLVVRADDDIRINSWDDVRKLGNDGIVLVINGFGIIKRLQDEKVIIDSGAYTSKTNFAKLLAGRGRFYYHRSPGIEAEIRQAGVEGKVRILPKPMHTEKFHLVVSKGVSAETVDRLNNALIVLERNGELARLQRKWSSESDAMKSTGR